MTLRTALALTLGSLLFALPAVAQTTVIDEGAFSIAIRGSEIGTESFSIRSSGSGANAATVAQGRVVLDTGEQTRTVLELRGPDLRPAAYQIEVSGDGRQSVRGRAAGNRFRATIVSDSGERMREYLISDRAVILDDGMAHHHYFLAASFSGGNAIPVILPRRSQQTTAEIHDRGSETIQVAGQPVSARHLSVEISGLDDRSFWVDNQNRILRLRIPAQDMVAVRTTLP